MAISKAHSNAVRAHGTQSHDPARPDGLARSSQNTCKHDIFGAPHLLIGGDSERYNALVDSLFKELQPRNFIERRLVREMITAEWTLQQIRKYFFLTQEKRMNELSASPDLDTAAAAIHTLVNEGHMLLCYESQYQRQFEKAYEQFQAIRHTKPTDRERIHRTAEEEQIRILKEYIEGLTPSDIYEMANGQEDEARTDDNAVNTTIRH